MFSVTYSPSKRKDPHRTICPVRVLYSRQLFLPKRIGVIHLQIPEVILPIPIRDFTHYPAWVSYSYGISRDIPRHDATCADHRIVSNGNTGKYHAVGTDPDIVADPDGQRIMSDHFPVQRIHRMSGGAEGHIGADHDLIPMKISPSSTSTRLKLE